MSFENLTYRQMMGNLASELTRTQRVLRKNDLVATKNYLWEVVEMLEIIKQKYPNSEIFRLYEYVASMWLEAPKMEDLQAVTKYSLDFYL